MPHRRRTSSGDAGVHLHVIMLPWSHPSPSTKQHLDRFSCFGRPLQVTVRPMLRDRCPVCPICL